MQQAKEIYLEHEKIGFPKISEQDQANMLIWHSPEIINKLTPGFNAEFIPPEVAKKYISISKETLREHFKGSGYIERLNENHKLFPKQDSQWVEKNGVSGYQLKVQERGGLVHIEFFDSYEELIDYFVTSKFKTFSRY
ncbi:hypothetical protein SAMN05661096_04105 [Marivirga sericea]|uniref:Uncharacterized protein n=1 Tax=Marivirga sericea TaxID=1028 RepID=A0A1X7LJ09_9BACT|nr:hypothetical protein [Marivirga sericea]SMG53856.1 hypothetical protein SAMN05661096_04105 [Marivirga sericea]